MMRNWTLCVLLLVALLTGCATAPSIDSAFDDADGIHVLKKDEQRFWLMSDQVDESLINQGAMYGDPVLDAYLQELVDKLFPEFVGTMRIRAVKDPDLNAFAMANGSLYINTGILARLNNEAELAAVLGHEGIHFTDRHVLFGMRKYKRAGLLASIAGISGYGLLGPVVGVSSVLGYSRAVETQADIRGFERVRDAGYDVSNIADTFVRFAGEIRASDKSKPWFFATHPRMERRAEAFERLAGITQEGGGTFDDRFLSVTSSARMDALAALNERGETNALIYLLDIEGRLELFPVEARYYLADAYRKRNHGGDQAKAKALFSSLVVPGNEYPLALARLGLIQMQQKENERALVSFRRYLELSPDAADRAYVKSYIESIEGEL